MSDLSRLQLAELNATAARQRLGTTLNEIQRRLSPSHLVQEAIEHGRETATAIANEAFVKVRSRPFQVIGVIASILALFSSSPVLRVLSALFDSRKETESTRDRFTSQDVKEPTQ